MNASLNQHRSHSLVAQYAILHQNLFIVLSGQNTYSSKYTEYANISEFFSDNECMGWHEILVLTSYHMLSNDGSGEPVQISRLSRAFTAHLYKERIWMKTQTQGFSYLSEVGTRGLLNSGKKYLDHRNWENWMQSKRTGLPF